ncbi:MAG: 16S rRNA (adenine(1518)-N(6)/adenine(1519)-N(6))-dimethyltransferase RsmA [Kangiella sp.]|nr:16S rRNA (adenine(1518)-N(6)/adenine(1519)-N(6))-dimethyltransferase RsmA [Kangiella sp.]
MVQGHQARKRFGQNFLSDNHYIQRIVESVAAQADDRLVEIGPGLGAITEHLVDKVAELHVVELDRDLIPRLEQKFAGRDNFTIHHSDALKFDFAQLAGNEQIRVVGNLPYNISTPLIFHLLNQRQSIKDMYFMLQKEVVERICAQPGTSAYGRLSVMTQYYCQADMLFLVPPGAFQPPPKVESAIVRLQPYKTLPNPVKDEKLLNQIVTAAFGQRRKTLRNSLKNFIDEAGLVQLGIKPTERAEQLSLAQFVHICQKVEENQAD